MIITVQINTDEPLSVKDLDLLYVLTGMSKEAPSDFPSDVERAESEAKAKAAPAAKKTAAKKAAAPAAKEPEPETPAEEPTKDLRATALALASTLLASGQREKVTAALAAAGAGRVSEVMPDKMAAFIEALSTDE